jgi:hypothetical protein
VNGSFTIGVALAAAGQRIERDRSGALTGHAGAAYRAPGDGPV